MKSVFRHLLRHASKLLVLLALCLLGVSAHAMTYTVNTLADSGPDSLRADLTAAVSGDTINFQSNLSGTILLTSPEPYIRLGVTIQGPGANVIAVDGASKYRVFNIPLASGQNGTVSISGLTIQNGYDESEGVGGGGLIISSNGFVSALGTNVALTNCVFNGNQSNGNGGAIYNNGATMTVTNCIITNNSGGSGGGHQQRRGNNYNGMYH